MPADRKQDAAKFASGNSERIMLGQHLELTSLFKGDHLIFNIVNLLFESNSKSAIYRLREFIDLSIPKPGHDLGRTAGRRGGVGQDGTPTEQFAQETSIPRTLEGIEDKSPERFSRSTNKRNPM